MSLLGSIFGIINLTIDYRKGKRKGVTGKSQIDRAGRVKEKEVN
jgi:hypothetical protein